MKSKEVISDKIHLIGVKIFKSNMNTRETFLDNPEKTEGFSFGFNHDNAFNFEENRMRLRLFFQLQAQNAKEEDTGVEAEYGIEFHYFIENMKDYVEQEIENTQIDAGFAATILGISYSTSRGIILERMQNTFFEGVILPVINPFEKLQDSVE